MSRYINTAVAVVAFVMFAAALAVFFVAALPSFGIDWLRRIVWPGTFPLGRRTPSASIGGMTLTGKTP